MIGSQPTPEDSGKSFVNLRETMTGQRNITRTLGIDLKLQETMERCTPNLFSALFCQVDLVGAQNRNRSEMAPRP